MDSKEVRIFNLEDVLPLMIVPKDGSKPYELLKFKFNNNTTNSLTAHGKLYRIELIPFEPNYRVDLYENDRMSAVGENTGNMTFRKLVNVDLPITEQIIHWASRMISSNDTCDCCGSLEIIIPLSTHDLEEFPHLTDKKVCQQCRSKAYNELIKKHEEEAKAALQKDREEMKSQGAKFHYTFWIHPNGGDDFIVDMFTKKKLTQSEIKTAKNELKLEYGARLVEEPSCIEL